LVSFVSHIICAWFAFLLPCYATFKALSHLPLSEPDLERWAMYWAVVGAFVAFEYVAEWLISWLPFYWETKTVLLLFLSLPQTQGSTYIYNSYLRPFFAKNEADFDAGIVSVQQNTFSFIQGRLTSLWEVIWSLLNKTPASAQPPSSTGQASGLSVESIVGLWNTYAPSVMSVLQPSGHTTPARSSSTTSFQSYNALPVE